MKKNTEKEIVLNYQVRFYEYSKQTNNRFYSPEIKY